MTKSSRARARERKKQRQQERQRNRQYLIIGAIVVVAVVFVGLFALSNLPAEAPLPDILDRYSDLQRGFTEEGFPMLGNPNAPVEVKEYSSFACPHCEEFHETSFPQLLERVAAGQISFVYVPRQRGIPNGEGANRAAMCAGEQGMFWEMHDVLFHWHNLFGNNAFQGNRLTTGAEELGLNMDAFNSCFNSSRISDLLTLAREEQIAGTPLFKVNDATVESPTLDAIVAAIENILGTMDVQVVPDEAEAVETEEPEADVTSDDVTEETDDSGTEGEEAVEATAEATESSE